ncbi:hypothetical protein JXL21_14820 [Candidatus Bathyarchaeota archaeon]|nr:hypothetical protein [Candidatus Bathyarchaeota archaeon]
MRHSFSVDLKSRNYLHQLSVSRESQGQVMLEGELGEITEIEYIEGKVLVVTGSNGVLRLDICRERLIDGLTAGKKS